MPPIHVCVHSLRDNGCSPGDIEIASVKLTYLSVYEGERRVGGSPAGRVKHKSISLHSTASGEKATTGTRTSRKFTVGGRPGRLYQHFCLHCEIFTSLYRLPERVPPVRRHKCILFDIYSSFRGFESTRYFLRSLLLERGLKL